ncbi:uncharacterized protein LOC124419219 [Lucilia cuprina]|uniref:uncharacterized protein LOC124419219 n=1 Tax=Lucilia cuprina TaxID=7375 RepID=UPI001F05E1B2|nr:uncharacterized protein LOC124419219 [Lucilia cuprina]
MTVKQRQYRYCSNCFARTHLVGECISMKACKECGDLYHTMLHPERSQRRCQKPQQRQRLQQQPTITQRRRPQTRQQMQSSRRSQQQPQRRRQLVQRVVVNVLQSPKMPSNWYNRLLQLWSNCSNWKFV